MKKSSLLLAGIISLGLSGQKKEIEKAYTALVGKNPAALKTELAAAESILNNNLQSLEPEVLEKYYVVKGASLLQTGQEAQAAQMFANAHDMQSKGIFMAKDAKKNKVYYVGKDAAVKAGFADAKPVSFVASQDAVIREQIGKKITDTEKAAMASYDAKNYSEAAKNFESLYYLTKAVGSPSVQSLQNAALSHISAKKFAKAEEILKYMIDNDLTGKETNYTAKDAKGKTTLLDKSSWDLFKKAGATSGYSDFKVENTTGIQKDIYLTYLSTLQQQKKYNEIIAFSPVMEAKFPGNSEIISAKGVAYYNTGRSTEFAQILEQQLKTDPSNKQNWYNLGVVLSKDPAQTEKAKSAFLKAVELDPKYSDAWQNLVFMIIGDDAAAVKSYKDLADAKKFDQADKILEKRKVRFQTALPYAEKWYLASNKSSDAKNFLGEIYRALKMNDKLKALDN